LFRTSTTW